MLCQNCQKRSANVHLIQVVNGKRNESYLCQQCAGEKSGLELNTDLDITDFLGGFISLAASQAFGQNKELHPDDTAYSKQIPDQSEEQDNKGDSGDIKQQDLQVTPASTHKDASGNPENPKTVQHKKFVCDNCGLGLVGFQKTGKLGCSNCYNTFGELLRPLLKRLHCNNLEYNGKLPGKLSSAIIASREITKLKDELGRTILNEEYEKAAILRDKIREMEGKGENIKI
ncbi:MAG: UvrB/UvrC motif-containing protein [Clostridiales bacterium]|nr:UvrB/UvrC motif-containing protein [Clostridiales bacterium]